MAVAKKEMTYEEKLAQTKIKALNLVDDVVEGIATGKYSETQVKPVYAICELLKAIQG